MHRKETIKRPAEHVFISDPGDPAVCIAPGCGLPQRNSVHPLAGVSDEQAALDARRLGERTAV